MVAVTSGALSLQAGSAKATSKAPARQAAVCASRAQARASVSSIRSFSGFRPSGLLGSTKTASFQKVTAKSLASKKNGSRMVVTAMFERFTEKAIKVVMLAQEEARRLGHNFVGTEQVCREDNWACVGLACMWFTSISGSCADGKLFDSCRSF